MNMFKMRDFMRWQTCKWEIKGVQATKKRGQKLNDGILIEKTANWGNLSMLKISYFTDMIMLN